MAWCFEDEANPYTESVLDSFGASTAVVPPTWPFEVANVLLVGERRQRLTAAQTVRFLQLLQALPITVDGEAPISAFGQTLAIGRELGLSAYDAACLALAARLGLRLATQDMRLRTAATNLGVQLLP